MYVCYDLPSLRYAPILGPWVVAFVMRAEDQPFPPTMTDRGLATGKHFPAATLT